ncbi:MAG: hypothetical protein QM705_07620 [Ancrocorticia sp.]
MEKKLRALAPRVRGRRVVFASLLILGMFLMQAFCHSVTAVDGSSPQQRVAHHMLFAADNSTHAGESVPVSNPASATQSHEDSTIAGTGAALGNNSFDEHSIPNAFGGDPCSAEGADSNCSTDAATSCLLILFLSAGLLIPQNARASVGSSRFIVTTAAPVRFLGSSPNLHALGISRT